MNLFWRIFDGLRFSRSTFDRVGARRNRFNPAPLILLGLPVGLWVLLWLIFG